MQITLKAARVNAGFTQDQVQQTTGFARSTLRRWEQGKTSPKASELAMLCDLYGVEIGQIKICKRVRFGRILP